MKPDVKDVADYVFTQSDKLFLDANIWIYVYFSIRPGWKERVRNFEIVLPLRRWARDILLVVGKVLSSCHVVESGFSRLDRECLLEEFSRGGYDFNDQVIGELCKSAGLTLVTDDFDFKWLNTPILTANKRLLNSVERPPNPMSASWSGKPRVR